MSNTLKSKCCGAVAYSHHLVRECSKCCKPFVAEEPIQMLSIREIGDAIPLDSIPTYYIPEEWEEAFDKGFVWEMDGNRMQWFRVTNESDWEKHPSKNKLIGIRTLVQPEYIKAFIREAISTAVQAERERCIEKLTGWLLEQEKLRVNTDVNRMQAEDILSE